MPVELTCKNCRSSYFVKPSRVDSSKFCSMECKSNNSRISVTCDNCGEDFSKYKRRVERSDADLCTQECREEYWSNNIAPEIDSPGESIELDCSHCGNAITKPKSQTLFDKTFCNKDCYGAWLSENNVGKHHPQYTGGPADKFTVHEKRRIFERDDYTCQDCESRGGNLNAHHIEPASENPDKVHDIDNGVTLCVECHAERHPKLRSLILS